MYNKSMHESVKLNQLNQLFIKICDYGNLLSNDKYEYFSFQNLSEIYLSLNHSKTSQEALTMKLSKCHFQECHIQGPRPRSQ